MDHDYFNCDIIILQSVIFLRPQERIVVKLNFVQDE